MTRPPRASSPTPKESPRPPRAIGMPVRNGAHYFEEAIRSLLAQTEGDFILHISDNCSADETPEICARLAAEDPRISYVRQEATSVPRATSSTCFGGPSPFFMWAAHDDIRPPDYLDEALKLLRENPDAVGCALGVDIIDESGRFVRHITPPAGLASSRRAARVRAVFQEGHFVIIRKPSKVVKHAGERCRWRVRMRRRDANEHLKKLLKTSEQLPNTYS